MAKRGREELLRNGEGLLEEWGVAGNASPAVLAASIGRMPAADLAIAHRLGGVASEESVTALQRLKEASGDKHVRKEAQRALYRLAQRGLQIPEVSTPVSPLIAAPGLEGHLSPVDGRGDQLVWLVKPRAGGVDHLFAVTNDPEGLQEVELNRFTRKALRAMRAELASKHELRLIEADWRYCDFLIQRGFDWTRARAGRIPGDYPALRAQLTKDPVAEEMEPLILSRLDPEVIDSDPALLAQSAALLDEKELRTWVFGPEVLQPYLDELASIKDSPLVLNHMQQDERFNTTIERAIEELFGGALRPSWVRRLYEMAYVLWATARPDQAKRAVAVARALARSEHGGREIPLCDQLTRASLAVFFQETLRAEEERSKSSLILTPQQIRTERERR